MGLGVILIAQYRVLFNQTEQALGHFVLFALLLRGNGHAQRGIGIGNPLQHHLAGRCAQRVARQGIGELRHSADVSGTDVIHIRLLLTGHHHGFANALHRTGTHIHQGLVRADLSTDHLHIGQAPDERIGHGLKHDGGSGCILVHLQLDRLSVHIHADLLGLFTGLGGQPYQAVHKLLHAAHQQGIAAEHRDNRAALHTAADAHDDLFGGELLSGEVLLEHFVAGLGNGLVNGGTQSLQTVAQIRHGDNHGLASAVIICLIFQNIDIDIRLSVHDVRHHHRAYRRTEHGLQILEHPIETGALVTQAVDKENLRQAALLGRGKCLFGSHFHTGFSGDGDQHGISRTGCLPQAAFKVKQTGGIQQVDLRILPLKRCHRTADTGAAADLLGIKIAYRIAVPYFSAPVRCTGQIQHSLCQ